MMEIRWDNIIESRDNPIGTDNRWVWNMESSEMVNELFQAALRRILEQSKERAIPPKEERLTPVALSDYIMGTGDE